MIDDLIYSFDPSLNSKAVFKAGTSVGRSGSFFFFTHDDRFLIKTLQSSDKSNLFSMLDDMIDHFRETKNSLIARIYGVFTLESNVFSPVDIVIMQNTGRINGPQRLIFDLKGSKVNR